MRVHTFSEMKSEQNELGVFFSSLYPVKYQFTKFSLASSVAYCRTTVVFNMDTSAAVLLHFMLLVLTHPFAMKVEPNYVFVGEMSPVLP